MALIFGKIFAAGHVDDEQNQNIGGFYLTSAITFAIIGLLGVIFIAKNPCDIQENDEAVLSINELQIEGTLEVDTGPPPKSITGLKLLRRFDYHFIAWSYIFCAGLQLMFQNNIQTYLTTFKLGTYTTVFGVTNPVCGVLSKLFVGLLSDVIVTKVPRVSLLLGFNIVQTITLTLCIFFSDEFPMLIVALLVIGFSNGAVWCLTPTMISEQ
jgi:Na+/melibiose symporter-like transporter